MTWKRLLRWTVSTAKWLIVAALCVEAFSFAAVSITNVIVYGHPREGSRAIYDPYTLFLQSRRVRPTAHNTKGPERARNRTVWVFGGSTIRGATRVDARTIPSFLSAYLNARGTGDRFTVVNFGTNSFNSLLETKYLQKLLISEPAPPDVIVFYDGANDAKYFIEHRTPDAHYGYRRTRALIESYYHSWIGLLKPLNAAFYSSFTKELYDRLNQAVIPLSPRSPALARMAERTEKRYDYVAKVSAAFGARFILFWQPMRWVEDCAVPAGVTEREGDLVAGSVAATMKRNFTVAYTAIADRLRDKPYFVSLRRLFCKRTAPAYSRDGVHLVDAGRRIAAEEIGRIVVGRFFK